MAPFIGRSMRRPENELFPTDRGIDADDVNVPGQARAYVIRPSYAHAVIDRIDTASALAVPRVLGIYICSDIADLGGLPCAIRSDQSA
jgi:carbon-monoxide dehydrogenase large subunit